MLTPTQLINKYNIPGPRYTSYPTVPYWDTNSFSTGKWINTLEKSLSKFDMNKGISIYIHLPFCESLCTFCGCNKRITKNHTIEAPYIDLLLKEWNKYKKIIQTPIMIKEIHLGGGTPTFFNPKNIKRLIEGILEDTIPCPKPEYSFEGHPNSTKYDFLATLYHLNFTRVSFGVQDYNDVIQKAINRIQPFENVERATKMAREIGYQSVGHDLVFGLPFQSLENVITTIHKTLKVQPDRLAFYSYAHVPWIKGVGQRGFKDEDLPSPTIKRQQYEEGKKLLEASGYNEIGMDHFALSHDSLYQAISNGSIHRNFMGYTSSITDIMIGLGVSSISDSWFGFAQNEKTLENYEKKVNAQNLPVFRGHILTKEDEIIRKHILQLMCKLSTSWEDKEMQFKGLENTLQKLEMMIKDGLLIKTKHQLKVTELGRPFIRNICMAFDKKLQANQPNTQLFSMTV